MSYNYIQEQVVEYTQAPLALLLTPVNNLLSNPSSDYQWYPYFLFVFNTPMKSEPTSVTDPYDLFDSKQLSKIKQ